jgi:hypothetical protein
MNNRTEILTNRGRASLLTQGNRAYLCYEYGIPPNIYYLNCLCC